MSAENHFLGKISSLSIKRYRIIYLAALITAVLGLYYYSVLPRESKPEVVFPKVKINVTYPGASPSDVEALVTNKLESVLFGIDDVEFLTSSSLAGRSEIQLDFYPEADMDDKIAEVTQAVLSVRDLPEDAEAPSIRISTTANRAFMVISLSGDLTPAELKAAADLITDDLLAVPGVDEIKISGLKIPEVRIEVDPARLAEFNLTVEDLISAVRMRHKDTPAGDVILDGLHYYVRVLGAYADLDDIRKTLVQLPGGGTIFLKDLALVEEAYQPDTTFSRRSVGLDTENAVMKPAVTLSLYRDGGTDIIGPSKAVNSILETNKMGRFPDALDVMVIQDDSVSVRNDLNEVLGNAASGFLVVILVLFLFLGFREALISSLIIPFSLFVSFAALYYAGMTFNTMTLLAVIIALGLLVDNAIVVVENVAIFREKGLTRTRAAIEGTAEVAPAIVSATLTTMAAFIPLALMGGRIGLLISVIPITVLFIIGASLIIALTFTPTLTSRILPRKTGPVRQKSFSASRDIPVALAVILFTMAAFLTKGRIGTLSILMGLVMAVIMSVRILSRIKKLDTFRMAGDLYGKLLTGLINRKIYRILVPATVILLLAAVLLTIPLGLMKIELFPVRDESAFYISVSAPEFSSLYDTDEITRKVEALLMDLEGIDTIYSEVGIDSQREAEIVLNLKPRDQRGWTTQEMIPELNGRFAAVPGAKISIGTSAGGRSANSPIQLQLTGYEMDELAAAAGSLKTLIGNVDGVAAPYVDIEPGYPEVRVLLKPIVAADLGVDSLSLGNTVKSFVEGQTAGTLLTPEGDLPIRFSTAPDKIDSVQDLEKVTLKLKDGSRVSLSQVAAIVETQGWGTIRHSGGDRTVTLYAQLLPDANIREVVDTFNDLAADTVLPDGVRYVWAGDAADLDSSFNEMFVNLGLALLIVFLILSAQFDSFTQPLVILLSVPMAVIGVFTGLLLTGNNFGLYAFMGVIALVGIAVNDAIVLVDTVNRNRVEGLKLLQAIVEAGRSRFGPVLATTLTTIGGILPLAFKDENFAQLSISLIFGLMASTVLTLIVLPIIYSIAEQAKVKIKKIVPIFVDEEI